MALKGISGDGELRRGRCGGLGRCERSGLGCSMKWTAAELLDTVRRRGVVGGRGYGEGGGGRGGGVRGGFGGERETDPRRHLARGAARRRAGAWRTPRSPSGTCLPAWPASSSLERCWAGPAGGLASGPAV